MFETIIKTVVLVWGMPFLLMLFLILGCVLWELWDSRI